MHGAQKRRYHTERMRGHAREPGLTSSRADVERAVEAGRSRQRRGHTRDEKAVAGLRRALDAECAR